jgi:hypothetical protein
MPRPGPLQASVFDLAGRRVTALYDGRLPAGPHQLHWNGRDRHGLLVANGMYFIRIATPWESSSAKITVLR